VLKQLDPMPEAIHAKLIHPEADAGKKISLHLQRRRSSGNKMEQGH
jgi:hypothetical protein